MNIFGVVYLNYMYFGVYHKWLLHYSETSQLDQYGDVVSKLRETQYQLQAALQRMKELKNGNTA